MRLATPKVFANCLAFVLVALLFYYVVFSSYLLLDMSKASVGRGGSNKSAATLSDLRFVPIVMKDADDLTPLDLYGEHGREPVIIKGALKAHPFMREGRNTPDHFAQVCGDALIDTVVYDSNYTGWAGHKDEILMTVRDFVDGYMVKEGLESSPHPEELRYAHSNSYGMPQLCPALQWEVLIPRHASIGNAIAHTCSPQKLFRFPPRSCFRSLSLKVVRHFTDKAIFFSAMAFRFADGRFS